MVQKQFSIWKRAIFCKVKEINDLSGGAVLYAAQSNPPIDAVIAGKGRFWTITNYNLRQQPKAKQFCSILKSCRQRSHSTNGYEAPLVFETMQKAA
jgi:hypothetical protein